MSSSSSLKSTSIDRDDYDADHYADFIRDTHRSRLTLEQLDIAKRQLRKKEKLLSRIHDLKMKEHTRIKNGFIRKIEQDLCISNLPCVKETLQAQRRKRTEPSSPLNSIEHPQQIIKQEQKSHQLNNHSKSMPTSDTPQTDRLKTNLDKFNHTNTLLS